MAEINRNPRHAEFKAPSSLGLRLGAINAISECDNPMASMGLAIGLCWHGPGSPKTRLNPGALLGYGLKVYDELAAREGVSMADIDEGSALAYKCLLDSTKELPTALDLVEAEGNSKARKAG